MRFSYKFFAVILAMVMITGMANGQQKNPGQVKPTRGALPLTHQTVQRLTAVEKAPHATTTVLNGPKALFDLLFSFTIPSPRATGVETDGNYIYASRWDGSTFYRYTLAGALVDSFSVTGVSAIRDLAYDGQYFYGGASGAVIYKMDFTSHTLVGTINCPAGTVVRHIAYNPTADAFWVGNWDDNFQLISRTGTSLQSIPAATHGLTGAYGSAYDPFSVGGPYLWIYDQGGNANDLVQLNATTGAPTGVTFDVTTVVSTTDGIAGGLFITDKIDPTKAIIGGAVQNETVWGLELATLVTPDDVSPIELINPLSSNILTASDSIKVRVMNNDTVAISNIPISYSIDGGTVVNNVITSIPASSNIVFTFDQPYDFSMPGHEYDVVIYTHLASDVTTNNDTLEVTVTNQYDVAPQSIDIDPLINVGSMNPMATVINHGTLATTFDVTMEIQGGYTSTKTVTGLAAGATTQVTFDPWNATAGNFDITVYTSLAQDSLHSNDTLDGSVQVASMKKVYLYVAYDENALIPQGPAYSYLESPATIVSLADQSTEQFIGAGTWGYGDQWLGVVYGDNTLVTIDTLTGARTILGNTGKSFTGIAYDYSAHKLYGVDWDGAASNLYVINALNGATTLVGACGSNIMMNLACDLTGNLFAVSTADDNLYSINKTTGVPTLIGPIGFDANYAQDMEFDLNTGILYMAAFNNTTSAGELRSVNTTTGATTLVGAFANNDEITAFGIPYHTTLAADDAAMVSVNGLATSCGLTSAEAIEITVKNMGTNTINSFDATYVLDGGTPVTEAVTATIASGATYTYTFTATADLSAIGNHTILSYVSLTGDTQHWNDTLNFSVTQVAPSSTPYVMGFEPGDDVSGWNIYDVNSDSYTWNHLTTGGNIAPGCFSYSYNSASAADDWAVSTCLSLNAGSTYKLSYYYMVESGSYPEAMDVFLGTGNAPADLTTLLADHTSLTNTDYQQNVVTFTVPASGIYYIGWHCKSDADMYNLYLDDINVSELSTNDAAVVSINDLNSSCSLGSSETISITVENAGLSGITTFNASFSVDGGTPVTETVNATIAAGATYDYTFTGTANLSTPGSHTVLAWVTLAGDTTSSNDTASATVVQVATETVPYSMGFETTDDWGAWQVVDVNGDDYTWLLQTTGGNTAPGCYMYGYNSASAANDWLISTCIQLETGKTYQVSFAYKAASASFPEAMMVHMGTGNTPADLTTMLGDYMNITATTYTTEGINFTVPANGTYYFGWHCYSDADMYNLFIDDINITDVTGVEENNAAASISISPNPVNGVLNIVSGAEISKISITNMVGEMIYNDVVNGKEFHINTQSFGQGMYFITFTSETGTTTQKFIVE